MVDDVAGIVEDSKFFDGPNNWAFATDADDIHNDVVYYIRQQWLDNGGAGEVYIVGFSRGAGIATWVANTLSQNWTDGTGAARGPISVEFLGLYDPVDHSGTIPDAQARNLPTTVANAMIIGNDDGDDQDYNYFDRIIDETNAGTNPAWHTMNLNATHGSIGGMPGFNDSLDASEYPESKYDNDKLESESADITMRTSLRAAGLTIELLQHGDYGFPDDRPINP